MTGVLHRPTIFDSSSEYSIGISKWRNCVGIYKKYNLAKDMNKYQFIHKLTTYINTHLVSLLGRHSAVLCLPHCTNEVIEDEIE